jgi:hypothetical protein
MERSIVMREAPFFPAARRAKRLFDKVLSVVIAFKHGLAPNGDEIADSVAFLHLSRVNPAESRH